MAAGVKVNVLSCDRVLPLSAVEKKANDVTKVLVRLWGFWVQPRAEAGARRKWLCCLQPRPRRASLPVGIGILRLNSFLTSSLD